LVIEFIYELSFVGLQMSAGWIHFMLHNPGWVRKIFFPTFTAKPEFFDPSPSENWFIAHSPRFIDVVK